MKSTTEPAAIVNLFSVPALFLSAMDGMVNDGLAVLGSKILYQKWVTFNDYKYRTEPTLDNINLCKLFKKLHTIFCVRFSVRLTEQIHNRIKMLFGFDIGTKCKLSTECGLVRGYIQPYEIADLFSKP